MQLSLPFRASEVIQDSEVHFVSEVSPDGEALANLTSLRAFASNFTVRGTTSLLHKQKLHHKCAFWLHVFVWEGFLPTPCQIFARFFRPDRSCARRISRRLCRHIVGTGVLDCPSGQCPYNEKTIENKEPRGLVSCGSFVV